MKCPHCGAENPDNGVFCVQCDQWILAKVGKPVSNSVSQQETTATPIVTKKLKIVAGIIATICLGVLCIATAFQIGLKSEPTNANTLPMDTATATTSNTTIPNTTVYEVQLPLSIDWNMTAYQITPEGDIVASFPITVKGDIWEEGTVLALGMDINWGDSFRYQYVAPNNGDTISFIHPTDKAIDFCAASHIYDRVGNRPAFCIYSIAPEKEYHIAYWGKEFGYYLVAATDPNVEPADILAYFADCLPYYIIKNG